MPIDQYQLSENEKNCTRMFRAETNNTDGREQITGLYWKRLFRSNYLNIVSQSWNDPEDDESHWEHWAYELTTLTASSKEDAQSKFDEFVLLHDRKNADGFFEIKDDPNVLGGYDPLNGELHLWSEALGSRTQGVDSLKEAKALYSDYVEESKVTEELGSDD